MTLHVHPRFPCVLGGRPTGVPRLSSRVSGRCPAARRAVSSGWGVLHPGGGHTSPRRMDVAGVCAVWVRRHREEGPKDE